MDECLIYKIIKHLKSNDTYWLHASASCVHKMFQSKYGKIELFMVEVPGEILIELSGYRHIVSTSN